MNKTYLTYAAVAAEGVTAWAFTLHESDKIIKHRFVHSASAAGIWHRVTAHYHALGHGLRWLKDDGRTEPQLIVSGSCPEVAVSLRAKVGTGDDATNRLRARCVELLNGFKWKYKGEQLDDNEADRLARWTWESATLQLYPDRPTGRKQLPALTKGGV